MDKSLFEFNNSFKFKAKLEVGEMLRLGVYDFLSYSIF